MRIAYCVDVFPQVSETFIANAFLELRARGIDVVVACLRIDKQGLEAYGEPMAWERIEPFVFTAPNLPAAIAIARPDLVHIQFASTARAVAPGIPRPGIPVVVSLRGTDMNSQGLHEPDHYRKVWERADGVHSVSEDLWRRAIIRGCPPDMPHIVIGSAVDTTWLDAPDRSHTEILGTHIRSLRIVSIARLTWQKGLVYGAQAVRLLMERGIACEWVIVGGGSGEGEIRHAIADLGLEGAVTLVGTQPHHVVREWLRWGDVALAPSVAEGFSVAVREAAAMRLPVVTTDCAGTAEATPHGVAALVVPRRDPAALAAALETLALDPALRQRLADGGRALVVERDDPASSHDATVAFYERIIAAHQTSPRG